MNTKVLLLVFLLLVASHSNAAMHNFFVVEKDFLHTQKIVEKYLSTKSYEVKQTNDKILEIYFDLPELLYLKQNGYIRFKAVEYLSNKKKKVKYIENIEYSLDSNNTYNFSVKHYKNIKTFEEKNPLLSLLKRKERQGFLDKLQSDGVKYPMRLKEIIQVSKLVHTFEFTLDTLQRGTISVNKIEASALDIKTTYIMLEVDATNSQVLIDDLIFLLGSKDNKMISSEYRVAYTEMKKSISLFSWIISYPYLVNLLYGISFGIFGLGLIFGLFHKRLL